jgi:site-specific recombinase
MATVHLLSDQKRQHLVRQLKRSSGAYWVSFLVFAVSLGLAPTLFWFFLLAWVVCHVWLASAVADWAAATNRASAIWGLGTFLLGPLGAIVMPMHALLSLRSTAGT